MVLHQRGQSTRNLGQNCRKDVVGILRVDVHFSVRLNCPEVNSKAKVMENCRHTMQSIRTSVFAEQSQRYVKNMNPFTKRTGRPVVMGQSIVLSAIKTKVPLESDDPANQKFLLQQHEERIEKLSQQDKLSTFCLDARFLSVVENGQYFMTKDTGDLTQFNTVICREYTLPKEEAASQPKGWIQGNTKIGTVLEVATSFLHGKHGVEVRIMSQGQRSFLGQNFSWIK